MSGRSEAHLSTWHHLRVETHSRLSSSEMTTVLLRTRPDPPTSERCARPSPHNDTFFPISQNASRRDADPILTIARRRRQKKMSASCLRVTEPPTPGCCFPYSPLRVTCCPLTPLNPREERQRSKLFPDGTRSTSPWPGPQMPALQPSAPSTW